MATIKFGSNIAYLSGLDVYSSTPVDSRQVVATYDDITTLATQGVLFAGALVYTEDEGELYLVTSCDTDGTVSTQILNGTTSASLEESRTITLAGVVDGSYEFDGSSDVTVNVSIATTGDDSTQIATVEYVDNAISESVSTLYEVKGSATVDEINALTDMEVGDVYNVEDDGTITLGDFTVSAGDNIVYIEDPDNEGSYIWDKLSATVDLTDINDAISDIQEKLDTIEEGAEVNIQADWDEEDTESDAYINNKPETLANPYALSLTVTGTEYSYDGSEEISVSFVALPEATTEDAGYVVQVDENGDYALVKLTIDDIDELQDTLDTKADKVTDATEGDLTALDAEGNLTDSGIASTNVLLESDYLYIQCTLDESEE